MFKIGYYEKEFLLEMMNNINKIPNDQLLGEFVRKKFKEFEKGKRELKKPD